MSPVARPTRDKVLVFATPAELRVWFATNHDTAAEAFIGYYRRGVGKPTTTWAQAVEEALCVGWIDGITFRVDEEVTANRFTPRRAPSNWSAVNIAKVAELTAAGRMHPAGIRAFEARTADDTGIYSYENRPADLPDTYLAHLRADEAAWRWWQAHTAGYRRTATWWVVSAKQEATRERRLAQLIEDCAAGRMIKSQRYGQPKEHR